MRLRPLLIIFVLGLLMWGWAMPLWAQEDTTDDTPSDPSEPSPLLVRIWIPDDIYTPNSSSAEVLETQVEEFNRNSTEFRVELRLKKSQGTGSLLTTLQAAQAVASSAMPDLVLLRRNDLMQAVRGGLVRQIDAWVPDTIRADLLPNVLELGIVDSSLYGLPYALQLHHAIYDADLYEEVPTSFDAVLSEGEQPFLMTGMPHLETEAVSMIVLGQYLAAGGRLVDNANVPTLDQEPLLEVLDFYANALEMGVVSDDVLKFANPSDYWSRLNQDPMPTAVVSSTDYLRDVSLLRNSTFMPIPTANGDPLLMLDGWMWALITADPDQQQGALAFLEMSMSAEAHADYTEAFGVLPSRLRALRIWRLVDYTALIEEWIDGARIIPTEQRNNSAAAQLQDAFEAVIGGTSPAEATSGALNALSSSG